MTNLDLNIIAGYSMFVAALLVIIRNMVDFRPEATFSETIGLLHVATVIIGVLAIYSVEHPEKCTANEFRFLTWFYFGTSLCMVLMAFVHAKHHKLGELACTVYTALVMATLATNNTRYVRDLPASQRSAFQTANHVFLYADGVAVVVVLVVGFFMIYDLATSNRKRRSHAAPRRRRVKA